MRRSIVQFSIVSLLVTALVLAIGHTGNDSPWLTVWFVLFFFVGVPLALLSVRDVAAAVFSVHSDGRRAWVLLHTCALFAAALGWLLGYMGTASDHPSADKHQWLVLVLPALVYAAPVLLAIQSGSFSFLALLVRGLRKRLGGGA